MYFAANTPRMVFSPVERNRNVKQRFLCLVSNSLDKVEFYGLIFTFARDLTAAALK